MTTWSKAITWRRLYGLIAFSGLLIPLWAMAAPTPTFSSAETTTADWQLAAYPVSSAAPSDQTSVPGLERKLRSRVAEARYVLTELRAFVEEATRAIKLGDQLKIKRLENDRLRTSLLKSQAEKKALADHVPPAEAIVSALAKTVVRNWLETVRLKNRSDEAHRELVASEDSWLRMERRVTTLRRRLAKHRSELHALRTERAALGIELGRVRQQISRANADTRRSENQQNRITAEAKALRRNVASTLRSILLENADR